MAQLSEWLELMLAEIARRQEEAQLDAEEEARRRREVADQATVAAAPQSVAPTEAAAGSTDSPKVAEAIEPAERRRRRG